MSVGGAVLRFGGLFIRVLQFCCAGIALGIFSYFLSVLADRDLPIAKRWQAVEGITGAAVIYTIFGIVLILFLGGKTFFGFLALVLDILFAGAFAAVAYYTRKGTNCTGNVQTPLGDGPSNSDSQGYGDDGFGFGNGANSTYLPNLGLACRFNQVVFAVSIIAIFLFLVSAIWQVLMVRHHKKEKKFGPSPANNYTRGSGKTPFWKRGGRRTKHNDNIEAIDTMHTAHDTPMTHHTHTSGTTPMVHNHVTRPSGDTGTTIGNNAYGTEPKYGEPGYGQTYGHQYDNRAGNF